MREHQSYCKCLSVSASVLFHFSPNLCTTLMLLRSLFLFFFFISRQKKPQKILVKQGKLFEKIFFKISNTHLSLFSLVPQETSLNLVLDNFTGSENRTDSAQHNTCSGRKASSKRPGHPEPKRPSLGVKQCFGLGANSALVLSAVTANNRINQWYQL